ncbi:MAG: MATE family efflux transporter [Bacteroidales bacterium]
MLVKDFTKGRILPQLMALALPIMGTGLAQMAYNFADVFWLGRLSSEAVAAASIAGFISWGTYALACLTKIGAEVCIAQAIGQKKHKLVNVYASHSIVFSLVMSVVVGILLYLFLDKIILLFGLPAHVNTLCVEYLSVFICYLPLWFLHPTLSGVFHGVGNSKTPFMVSTIALLINIVLDPFLIFGYGSFPALGVRGAAVATCVAIVVEVIIFAFLIYNRSTSPLQHKLQFFKRIKFNFTLDLIKIGAPPAVQNALFAVLAMVLLTITASVGGHIGVAVQGTGVQIESLSWVAANGVATALGAYIGQNYGAQKMQRVTKSFVAGVGAISLYGIIIGAVFMIFGEAIFSIFIPNNPEVLHEGKRYLFVFGISQMMLCAEIATAGAFNGIGRSYFAASISVLLTALRIPLALWLSTSMGLEGVWWAMCISTLLKGLVLTSTFSLFVKHIKFKLQSIAV